jgi:oligopeptidase B
MRCTNALAVGSMADSSIPLTVGEWEEWGNPNEEEFYQVPLESR